MRKGKFEEGELTLRMKHVMEGKLKFAPCFINTKTNYLFSFFLNETKRW